MYHSPNVHSEEDFILGREICVHSAQFSLRESKRNLELKPIKHRHNTVVEPLHMLHAILGLLQNTTK